MRLFCPMHEYLSENKVAIIKIDGVMFHFIAYMMFKYDPKDCKLTLMNLSLWREHGFLDYT